MTTANISLKVPFNEKDQAKALGARWNAELKQWYVPQGVDSTPFAKWLTDATNTARSSTPAGTLSSPLQKMTKGATNTTANKLTPDDDMDAINARLREAFEDREFD